ncbi:TetR/AcrR family transcriptional regulator [Microlunatus soli]|uniref:DNA-binding transcriptional regulator, AcrR family n=1 Tax=Microlunatus soli TaxID=630515 RepID=A0A1H1YCC7_9ACTN|nr:TetR/AcrR family transcriptional regulator [Microlunatus soli]SDT18939.1 DNA-binding transcriptional regulator, AcrR family [Microlunatus soli]
MTTRPEADSPVVADAVTKAMARRDELATAALRTLGERGYANTSIRDVAQNSEYSHGVLHYYFADKTDLISHCVRLYKRRCVRRYDHVTDATTADEVAANFIAALLLTLHDDTSEQRLWYDMRSESLFEPAFRADVAAIDDELRAMVWRIIGRYAELAGQELIPDPDTAYAVFDGVFQRAVQSEVAGDPEAGTVLEQRIRLLLPQLLRNR